ncbi:hypothetical protein [Vibrio sinaloensis]|uniref:hypothetical protein n=1 Tax=Photobacterium sp. (strain ATCC 43367) TaxID=379097 RepID=UPI0022B06154|nr:hypothetical protein [Vibrio sinaloensis]MCZ4295237.1 hypothetical protein [Vibrio sinaloensis]
MTKSRFETGTKIKYLQSNRPNGQMFFNNLATVEGNISFLRGNIYVEAVFSGAVNVVDYMLHDEKTLGEVVGQFTADSA